MYFIDFNEVDEDFKEDLIKFLKNYYNGVIYDDESLQKYVENELKNKEPTVKKTLTIRKHNI